MISIIVPVYNAEKRIEKCLLSLVHQTYKDLEIIVINDGSTDNSDKIIRKFYNDFSDKIKYISRENKGIGYTRNEGVKLSSSSYIGFVDSDDFVENDMYEKLYKKILLENADIAICNYKIFDSKSSKNVDVCTDDVTSLKENPKMINLIDYAPWNKLYKKELFDDIKFPENLKYEDLDAILKVFSKAKKIVKINDYCYNYYVNPSGETVTIDKKIYDIFKVLDDLILYFKDFDKIVRKQIKVLCLRKLFVYTELSLNKKDINFTFDFLKNVYNFLDNNFVNWKLDYIMSSNDIKTFILRVIQCNHNLYKKRLIKKLKKLED